MGDATRSYSPQAAVLQSEAYNEFRVWVNTGKILLHIQGICILRASTSAKGTESTSEDTDIGLVHMEVDIEMNITNIECN